MDKILKPMRGLRPCDLFFVVDLIKNCCRTSGRSHFLETLSTKGKPRLLTDATHALSKEKSGEYYRYTTRLLTINAFLLSALLDRFALALFRCCFKVAMLLHIKENPSFHHLALKAS